MPDVKSLVQPDSRMLRPSRSFGRTTCEPPCNVNRVMRRQRAAIRVQNIAGETKIGGEGPTMACEFPR
jgi:hypothetical protein